MKIAISSTGKDISAAVDPRFGRAAGFIIYDMDKQSFEYVDNAQNLNAMQGAGIQAAKNISDSGAQAVLTGHCGPKAFAALKAAGLKIYSGASGTVAECIEGFKAGTLEETLQADVEGHWN